MALSLIAAVNRKGYIGLAGRLPWHDMQDIERLKALTAGQYCIVGRVTYENLPPSFFRDRHIIPVSHAPNGLSLDTAIDMFPDAFIIGGAQIYEAAMKTGKVKYYYLTMIDDDTEGDVHMPPLFYGITPADILKGMKL